MSQHQEIKTEKKCSRCDCVKPVSEFHRHYNLYQSRCKDCVRESDKLRSTKPGFVEKRKAALKRNYDKNGHRYRENAHMKQYGISVSQRMDIYKSQNGLCASCGDQLTARTRHKNLTIKSWLGELDHDHITGQIRGILCLSCNTAFGLLKEDIGRIDKLKWYATKC